MAKATEPKPRMFIGSSVEGLSVAYSIQESLEHDVEATVWNQGVFELSRYTLEALIDALADSDFALFVLQPDDVVQLRDAEKQAVRDNVIFELGLFIGRIGKERCFLVMPRGVDNFHLPTDLLGITPGQYEPEREDGNLLAALGPACQRVRRSVKALGRLQIPTTENAAALTTVQEAGDLTEDPDDCLSLIQSWMGSRSSQENGRAIRYSDVDRELKLVPGSAERYIEEAAKRWRYEVERRGKDTILFSKTSGLKRTIKVV
ncbi:TIR domain-containing protein [Sphingomonas rubra]|uniref:TIR domain-containing protein n=1 Tax=Sphingomonas rubra TaxID=634430 RepID=UPI000B3362D1|nr:nucleotide-binding protein [Sphingomonas rubra]